MKLERIATLRAVNATAARVVSSGPKGYESTKNITATCSPAPLPIRDELPNTAPDLRGVKRGRLTVIGFDADKPVWVCRCVCGYYVHRRTKSLCNESESKQYDACDRCREVDYLRRSSLFQQLGYNPK
jgi:hypothetical protein